MQFLFKILTAIISFYFLLGSYRVRGSSSVNTNIKLFVEGNGFHRLIKYKIEPNLSVAKCYITLLLKLPSSLYVNVDELAELRRKKKNFICSKGETDVESFTEKALPQEVFVCSLLKDVVTLSIPIHQRYQYATVEGGYKNVTLPKPEIFIGCQDVITNLKITKADFCSPCNRHKYKWHTLPYKFENETYIWQVPVGQTSHSRIIVFITLLTTIFGSIYILRTIWRIDFTDHKED